MSDGATTRYFVESGVRTKCAECAECPLSRARDELIRKLFGLQEAADRRLARLTHRQYEIMEMVLAGHPSKNIAMNLNISQRTVENHRAEIMKRTGARSLPELARLALAADWSDPISTAAQGADLGI